MSEAGAPAAIPGPVVALDLGEVRIGVAVSDRRRILARPYGVIVRTGDQRKDHAEILNLVEEVGATQVVVGLPLLLSGRAGAAATKALAEIEELKARVGVPVAAHDERLSTVEATRRVAEIRREGRGSRAPTPKRRAFVDDKAATVLLESYLSMGERR